MTTSFTFAQIEHFKREAKQLRRTISISHSHALDQIANANGFGNWSLLAKHSDTHDPVKTKRARAPFLFVRTSDLMRSALLKVPDTRGWGQSTRSDRAQQQVEDISAAFVSPQNAVEYAIEYVTCLFDVPIDRTTLQTLFGSPGLLGDAVVATLFLPLARSGCAHTIEPQL